MSYWLAATLQSEREAAGISRDLMALSLGVGRRTIDRLEAGSPALPPNLHLYMAGYAHVLGIDDGRELWRRALANWDANGKPPQFKPEGSAALVARAVREAARQAQRGDPSAGARLDGAA